MAFLILASFPSILLLYVFSFHLEQRTVPKNEPYTAARCLACPQQQRTLSCNAQHLVVFTTSHPVHHLSNSLTFRGTLLYSVGVLEQLGTTLLIEAEAWRLCITASIVRSYFFFGVTSLNEYYFI